MSAGTINLQAVRLVQLAAQGLLCQPDHKASKRDVLEIIRQMGALQIDTIHVVARSPYLVLFSRLGDYRPDWLDQLLAEGDLFEYWAHAACFLPIEDYPLYAYRMDRESHPFFSDDWKDHHAEAIGRVMQHLTTNGQVRSADFERTDGQKGGWWNWKEEKQVLEFLHATGRAMIARREKFQRVYDLRERVMPDWQDEQALPRGEAEKALTEKAVRCLGIAHPRWVPDYFRLPKRVTAGRLEELAEEGHLRRVQVEGWEEAGYIHADHMPLLERALAGELSPDLTTVLSPFDPLVWDRERARTLFHFDFGLECYLPEAKRRYGYFSLPLLHRGRLIGRLDCKAHRKAGRFEVKSFYLDEGVEMDEGMAREVGAAVERCAAWHGTPQVDILQSWPEEAGTLLRQQVGHLL